MQPFGTIIHSKSQSNHLTDVIAQVDGRSRPIADAQLTLVFKARNVLCSSYFIQTTGSPYIALIEHFYSKAGLLFRFVVRIFHDYCKLV